MPWSGSGVPVLLVMARIRASSTRGALSGPRLACARFIEFFLCACAVPGGAQKA